MADPIHIAITRHVRKEHVEAFERALAEFATRSFAEPGARGVHLLYPAPGSGSTEYGILRSFASEPDRDAFYASPTYLEWVERIEPLVEGSASYRRLGGLEAFFRDGAGAPPPRWKMAVLTWIAVWPVSMLVPALLVPLVGGVLPKPLTAGVVAAGIVTVLTWIAMPALVATARPWLHPKTPPRPPGGTE